MARARLTVPCGEKLKPIDGGSEKGDDGAEIRPIDGGVGRGNSSAIKDEVGEAGPEVQKSCGRSSERRTGQKQGRATVAQRCGRATAAWGGETAARSRPR